MIGNLLLPIVAKILPYINAFVIALQRLFMWLGKVLGIDLSKLTATKKNAGGDNSPISDILDDAEDLSGALDDDADSAKKLKKQLQGFDALNNLTTNEDKTKGLDSKLASGLLNDAFLDAVDDYLKAWQKAFDQLSNKAERIADKIAKFFKRLAKPVFDAWKKVGDKVVQQWKNAGYNLKLLFAQIGKDFWRVWEDDKTTRIFENIFSIFGNIGEIVQHLANRFREAWVANDNGYRILSSIRDIVLIITEHFRSMTESTIEWVKKLNLRPLLGKMAEYLKSLEPVIDNIMGIIEDFYNQVLLPLGKWVLEKGLPDLLQVFIDFNKDVDWEGLRSKLQKVWEHLEPFGEKVGEGLILFVQDITTAVKDFINGDKFQNFLDKLVEWMDETSARDIADALWKIAKAIVGIKIAVAGFTILKGAVDVFKTLIDVCKGAKFASKGVGVLVNFLSGGALKSLGGLKGLLTMDFGTLFGAGTFAEIGLTIGTGILGGLAGAFAGGVVAKILDKHLIAPILEHLGSDSADWYRNFKWFGAGGFFDELDYFVTEMIPSKMDELKGNIKIGIGNAVIGIMEKKSEWDGAIEGFKVDTALKTAEIASEFMQFKENVATSLGDMAVNAGVKLAEASNKFAEFKTNVSNHIEEAKANVSAKLDEWKAKFTEWKENLELKVFDAEIWRGILDKIRQGASKAWTDLTNWWNNTVVKKLNEWVTSIKKKVEEIKQYFRDIKNELKNGESLSWQMPWNRNTRNNTVRSSGNLVYANGGFPEDGMFFANHNELVGKFSNGKTAVANNEQIVSGIENGVYGAMSESNSLLEEQNSLLRAILDKETGIKASDIFDSVMSSADSFERQTGRKAFA